MVELTAVRFAYEHSAVPLLNNASLRLSEGEHALVRGPSGSGKSTLLSLVSGALRPQSGGVVVNARKVSELSDAEARAFRINEIGFIFQDFALIEYLDVLDNVLLPYRLNPALKLTAEVRERARRILATLGISAKESAFPVRMSFGERQRAAIARAVVTSPKLILADEPTANLDALNAEKTVSLILETANLNGAGVVMVSHDPALAKLFSRIVEMNTLVSNGHKD